MGLIDKERCEVIVGEYYRHIFNYCYAKMMPDFQGAEDCTQETFTVLVSKRNGLDEDNIRAWLYRTADNVMKSYERKGSCYELGLEDSKEIMNIPVADFSGTNAGVFDCLTSEERRIVYTYYDSDYGDKKTVAKTLGMSLPSLYQKIHKIKKKLKKTQGKIQNREEF